VRLATFNILHGRSLEDGQVDVNRLADSVRALDADVVGLQEVDRDQPRSDCADLTAVAAEAMGAVDHQFVAALSGTPGGTWMAATGEEQPGSAAYGVALLSRYPVRSWRVVRLPALRARVQALGAAPDAPPPDGLSSREVQILGLVARGLSNREIGAALTISEHTAANHVRSILRKTGCANRTQAASYAHRHGLLEAPGRLR
jgi:DNA-binding CsgD family transcriptional regulator